MSLESSVPSQAARSHPLGAWSANPHSVLCSRPQSRPHDDEVQGGRAARGAEDTEGGDCLKENRADGGYDEGDEPGAQEEIERGHGQSRQAV